MNWKTWPYWLRGIGLGIIIFLTFGVILSVMTLNGAITCNAFVTQGPPVDESILCGPVTFLVGMPLKIITEIFEDIFSITFNLENLLYFLGLIFSIALYFAVFAFIGWIYGKIKSAHAK